METVIRKILCNSKKKVFYVGSTDRNRLSVSAPVLGTMNCKAIGLLSKFPLSDCGIVYSRGSSLSMLAPQHFKRGHLTSHLCVPNALDRLLPHPSQVAGLCFNLKENVLSLAQKPAFLVVTALVRRVPERQAVGLLRECFPKMQWCCSLLLKVASNFELSKTNALWGWSGYQG